MDYVSERILCQNVVVLDGCPDAKALEGLGNGTDEPEFCSIDLTVSSLSQQLGQCKSVSQGGIFDSEIFIYAIDLQSSYLSEALVIE